ncbi:MAG: mechanosensitive ion channel domain-containing protein [Pseudomonadota bacterium]
MNALTTLSCALLLHGGVARAQTTEAPVALPADMAPVLVDPQGPLPPADLPTAAPDPEPPAAVPAPAASQAPSAAPPVEPEPLPLVEPPPTVAPPPAAPEPATETPAPTSAPVPAVSAPTHSSPAKAAPSARKRPAAPEGDDDEPETTQLLGARLLPRPPRPDLGRALLLFGCMLAFMAYAAQAERPIRRLRATGLLPTVLKASVVLSRTGALAAAFVGLLHLVPAAWTPAVSYVLVGTALAIGWSVREVVQDVLVGLIFTLEHSFDLGQRLRFEGINGTLIRMTFRVTWLKTDEGAEIAIPNRRLTGAVLELDPQPYTPVEVTLLVPPCRTAVESRRVLRELALLNPYLAPEVEPLVHRLADDPRRWKVTARLVDARFADRFRGAMVDMVEEVFGPVDERCATHPRRDEDDGG